MRWLSRGTDLLRGLPNQRLYGGVAGEVVTEERASGSNRLRGKAQAWARVIGWRTSVIGKLHLDLYVRSSAARSAMDPCRVAWQIPRLSSLAASTSFHRMPAPTEVPWALRSPVVCQTRWLASSEPHRAARAQLKPFSPRPPVPTSRKSSVLRRRASAPSKLWACVDDFAAMRRVVYVVRS